MSKEPQIKLTWLSIGTASGILVGLVGASAAWGDMRTDVKYIRVTVDQDHVMVEQHETRLQKLEQWLSMKGTR